MSDAVEKHLSAVRQDVKGMVSTPSEHGSSAAAAGKSREEWEEWCAESELEGSSPALRAQWYPPETAPKDRDIQIAYRSASGVRVTAGRWREGRDLDYFACTIIVIRPCDKDFLAWAEMSDPPTSRLNHAAAVEAPGADDVTKDNVSTPHSTAVSAIRCADVVTVPIDPTDKMASAGETALMCGPRQVDIDSSPSATWAAAKTCWREMIAAAPTTSPKAISEDASSEAVNHTPPLGEGKAVAWLRWNYYFRASQHGQDAEGAETLELCASDTDGAFPVYAHPLPPATGDEDLDLTAQRTALSPAAAGLSPELFVHVTPKCEHEFAGWRDFEDGRGGEQICTKCGIGAMSASLRDGP